MEEMGNIKKLSILENYYKECIEENRIPYLEILSFKEDISLENIEKWKENEELASVLKKITELQKFMLIKRLSAADQLLLLHNVRVDPDDKKKVKLYVGSELMKILENLVKKTEETKEKA